MSEKKTVELVSPDKKRTWSSNNAVEITNLRAKGWRNKPAEDAPASTDEPAGESVDDRAAAVAPGANQAAAAKITK